MNDQLNDLLKESQKLQEDLNKTNHVWTNTKSLLVAVLIVAVALVLLVGSVVVIPTILAILAVYLLFLAVRQLIS